ncbi:MAG: tetratricopeptide (TPR) repeat protein [Gammaproteobacteria bacterium]|jgi:tetratricopeptide (TPR) repeat protein
MQRRHREGLLLAAVLAFGSAPVLAAGSAAEICAAGTGLPREDVLVCTRALILPMLPAASIATLHNARGRALRLIGEPDKALTAHNTALTLNPLSAEAHLGRAEARMVLGDAVAATADTRAALALNPWLSGGWSLLGRIHFLTGDDPTAGAALDKALELNARDG